MVAQGPFERLNLNLTAGSGKIVHRLYIYLHLNL